jgi:ssDNA-binding Zn-finger/Zn-ribbon topoisomerase 1
VPKIQKFKYEIGYKFSQYEIIDTISRPRPNGKNRYLYVLKCLNCGTLIEREEYLIGKDIQCKECKKNMVYSRFNVGDIVNDLLILEKRPITRNKYNTIMRAYLCRCLKDGYTSIHTEDNLLKGNGCPVCAGTIIMRGVNDINTVAPWLGDLIVDKDEGYKYGIGSHSKVVFRCPHCGTLTKPIAIYNVYNSKRVPCRKCSDGISMPEKLMYGILEQLNIDFEYQKQFSWSCGKFYDFYIPDKNMIIETHGKQHFEDIPASKWGKLQDVQDNDSFKKDIALQNGIKQYVTIDCSSLNPLVVMEACMYEVGLCFDLTGVDCNAIILNSSRSFCIKAGDLWNQGNYNVYSIAKILRLSDGTIRRYLRTLNKIGYLNINYPVKNKN